MWVRPLVVAAVCSFVAALALVIVEAAVFGAHSPQTADGSAAAPNTHTGNGAPSDSRPQTPGAFGADPSKAPADATAADQSDQSNQSDQSSSGGDTSQSDAGPSGIDTWVINQLPVKIGP